MCCSSKDKAYTSFRDQYAELSQQKQQLAVQLAKEKDFETFFREAPKPNPARTAITGVICGVRIETIEDPTMREIRYLDKLVDDLAKGKPLAKVLRSEAKV
mgnify:CR=1 FL=1